MVRIRLRRVGLKKQPSYRIVVADKRSPRDGRFIEIIGHHNPRTQPTTDVIDEARALYWLSVGSQPSDAVKRIMKRTGTWERFERLRQGEEMEKLVAEALEANANAEAISPQTRYPAPGDGNSKIKAKAAALESANLQAADADDSADTDDSADADDSVEKAAAED